MTTVAEVTVRVFAALWRDGGQRGARRNAWVAMVSDNQRARGRAEAEALLAALDSPHGPRIEGRQPGA